jgi:2-polyprenyl-3-methyl-5-hydroxy-6-metoxy-1,4-benzoquinol methylase
MASRRNALSAAVESIRSRLARRHATQESMKPSRDYVVLLYETLLGRVPEPEGLSHYTEILEQTGDLRIIVDALINSEEYANRHAITPAYDRLKWAPPIHVDVDVPDDAAHRLLQATAQVWQKLGETDAHWSVITRDDFRREVFSEKAEAAFYETGGHDYISLARIFERAGESLESVETVFELGCGAGRVTEALASNKKRVLAVDISAPHLALAAERMEKQGITNVELKQIKSLSDLDLSEMFDLIYTVIVLQHNPPPVAFKILNQLLNSVNYGGYIFFQIPTYIFDYEFKYQTYVPQEESMEMHCVPMTNILRLLSEKGYTLIEVFEDDRHGDDIVSHMFLAQRSTAAAASA